MEFASRSKCIEHYQQQFPNLPRYMIEMALDYDLDNGATSNEKPLTGKERRKVKKVKQQVQGQKRQVCKQTEIDSAVVIPQGEYKMAPVVPGYISVDGMDFKDQVKEPQEIHEE